MDHIIQVRISLLKIDQHIQSAIFSFSSSFHFKFPSESHNLYESGSFLFSSKSSFSLQIHLNVTYFLSTKSVSHLTKQLIGTFVTFLGSSTSNLDTSNLGQPSNHVVTNSKGLGLLVALSYLSHQKAIKAKHQCPFPWGHE